MMPLHFIAASVFGPLVEFLFQLISNTHSLLLPSTSYLLLPASCPCANLGALMSQAEASDIPPLYCPKCAKEVDEPLVCGDCSAVICKRCGSPLEVAEDLGMG